MKNYLKNNWLGLLISVVGIELIGGLAGLLSRDSAVDYQLYQKPPLSPPSVLFGIVWPILYALMGIAVYRIYKSPKGQKRTGGLILFALQLLINLSWPVFFFTFGLLWPAFFVILTLNILVIINIKQFYSLDRFAGVLMLPYLAWILFAGYLNLGIALLNR